MTSAEPIAPVPPSTLRKIFIGKDGLRAGWGLLIFIALFAAVAICINVIGHKIYPPAAKTARAASHTGTTTHSVFVSESIGFLVTLLVTWIMSKIEGRPNSVYGLGGSHKVLHFVAGLASGVICISLLVLTLWKTGLLIIDSRLLFGRRHSSLRSNLAVQLPPGRPIRGVQHARLPPVHPHARPLRPLRLGLQDSTQGSLGVLDLSRHFLHPVRPRPRQEFWRIPHRAVFLWLGRHGLLPQPLAHRFALVGHRLPHVMELGPVVPLYGVADSGTMFQHRLLATHAVGKPLLSGGATGPEGSIFCLAILVLASLIIFITLPRSHYGDTPERST